MEKDNLQNTNEKITDTSELRATEAFEAHHDEFAEKEQKKQNVVAIVICVIIAFAIWLIISNINMDAATPAPLPAYNGTGDVIGLAE